MDRKRRGYNTSANTQRHPYKLMQVRCKCVVNDNKTIDRDRDTLKDRVHERVNDRNKSFEIDRLFYSTPFLKSVESDSPRASRAN